MTTVLPEKKGPLIVMAAPVLSNAICTPSMNITMASLNLEPTYLRKRAESVWIRFLKAQYLLLGILLRSKDKVYVDTIVSCGNREVHR